MKKKINMLILRLTMTDFYGWDKFIDKFSGNSALFFKKCNSKFQTVNEYIRLDAMLLLIVS